jgi:dienelactone hydrolase
MNPSIEQINKEKAIKARKNLMNLTIEDLEFANEYSRQVYDRVGNGNTKGYGAEPPENDLNLLSQAVYKGRNDIPGYQLLEAIPTIGIYKQIASNTIVIAVRGSADLQDWKTNAQLPFNNLVNTSRYKTDKEFVMNAIQKYGDGNDVYITGHSLGGQVAEQLKRDFEQIKSGVTFNPAFESKDLLNLEESTVKRRYTAEDPLGILGRNIKGAEVEDKRNLLEKKKDDLMNYLNPFQPSFLSRKLKGHKLTEFESRKKGGMEHGSHMTDAEMAAYKEQIEKEWKELYGKPATGLVNLIQSELSNPSLHLPAEIIPIVQNFVDNKVGGDLENQLKFIIRFMADYNKTSILIGQKVFKKLYEDLGISTEKVPNTDPNSIFTGAMAAIPVLPWNYIPKFQDELDMLNKLIKEKDKKFVIAFGKPDGYALHAIIIKKKGYNKNDAVVEAVKFKTSKGLFMRETKLSYRFRNIPKTKFDPKTFRTKKINKDISLVYGQLK